MVQHNQTEPQHYPESISARDVLLQMMMRQKGVFIPGRTLAAAAGVTRAAVWKHIAGFRSDGFQIDAAVRKGYRLVSAPDRLLPQQLAAVPPEQVVGSHVVYFTCVDSTNRAAKEYALQGAADGTVIVAEEQSSGRGRLDRAWISAASENILCSIILYPALAPPAVFQLTMIASIAVVRTLKHVCGLDCGIKWPNDVYCRGKKICGILTEFMAEQDRLKYVVIGIGLNVNARMDGSPELADIAISARDACGQQLDRNEIMAGLLRELDGLYKMLRSGGAPDIKKLWEKHSIIIGRSVTIHAGSDRTCGTARGITESGQLVLTDHAGREQLIVCGDLSLRIDCI